MKRASAVAGVAVVAAVALAIGIGASGGSRSAGGPGIAYVTGGARSAPQVWIADLDGRHARSVGSGTEPLLSPDGSTLAASSSGSSGRGLTLYSASGSARRSFFDRADASALAQAWSPDSRYLAVVLASTDPASDAASGLAVIDARTSSVRILAHGAIYGASFAPDSSHRIVYASAATSALSASVDLHIVAADGSGSVQLTHDGRSLNPVWGMTQIAFDREQLRAAGAPVYQLCLIRSDGVGATQLTRLDVPPLLDGLVPIAFSADGGRLLAEYEGQDTSRAWAITVATRRLLELQIGGHSVAGSSISRDGAAVLVDRGGFLNPPDNGAVESVPFAGGPPTGLVAHGSEPSWNR